MFCSVIVWFYLCHRMFKILSERHPEKYVAMGKPSLVMNNTISNSLSFLKFLLKREWQDLNDQELASLGKGMLVFFIIYTVLFLCLCIGAPLGLAP